MARAYGRLWLDRDTFKLQLEPHVQLRFKRIFGKVSRWGHGVQGLSYTPENCRDLEWFCSRYALRVDAVTAEAVTRGAARHRDTILRLEQIIDPSYAAPSFTLALPLRDYQAREAAVHLAQGFLLNGDEVGLGKTAAAIASFTDPRALPAAVVCDTHMAWQWRDEIAKFAPALQTHIVRKVTPYELPTFMGHGPDVVICTYSKLAGWGGTLSRYAKSVVFDEIQALRHAGTQRYEAAKALADSVGLRLGLSATPIYNYGGEIFHVFEVLKPGVLGTLAEFAQEWCTRVGPHLTIQNPKAFGAYLREHFLLIRHTRREVRRELPAVSRIPHTIGADRARLDEIEDSAVALAKLLLREGEERRGQKLQAAEELSSMLRQATGIAKAPYVADFIRMLVECGERVVLCGWHRAVYDIWRAKLKDLGPVMFTGSETAVEKEAARRAFIDKQSPVLILSLRSGAGMNGLQDVSSVIVFGELDWSPGVLEQCVGRLHRDGQTAPVLAYFLLSEDGADPVMAETLGLKRAQVEGIRDPYGADVIEQIEADGERTKRLARFYLQKVSQRQAAVQAVDGEESE